jgi:signal transduction histidine kinase
MIPMFLIAAISGCSLALAGAPGHSTATPFFRQAERAGEVATAQERTRLARELHDAVTQAALYAVKHGLA